jgi:hypothetical protein
MIILVSLTVNSRVRLTVSLFLEKLSTSSCAFRVKLNIEVSPASEVVVHMVSYGFLNCPVGKTQLVGVKVFDSIKTVLSHDVS